LHCKLKSYPQKIKICGQVRLFWDSKRLRESKMWINLYLNNLSKN
jgi:hypothetical protein